MKSLALKSFKKAHVIGMLVLSVGLLATPQFGNAQDARVAKSMAALKDQTTKLGAPKIDGIDEVGGRDAPVLYFGSTKMNNNFSVVDAVAEEGGVPDRDAAHEAAMKWIDDLNQHGPLRIKQIVMVERGRKWMATVTYTEGE